MKAFVQERGVFVSVPTGFGKSLCYSLLPLVFNKIQEDEKSAIVIVVLPLLALMTDQVNVYINMWVCNHLHGFNLHCLLQMS